LVHAVLLADGVEWHHVVGLFLELVVEHLPLLFKSGNQLLALTFGHQEFLTVLLILIFDLHFADEVVFVLDFVLNFGQVLWYRAEVLFL
jgi:hypothetical protein